MFYRRILDACRARYHIDVTKESTENIERIGILLCLRRPEPVRTFLCLQVDKVR